MNCNFDDTSGMSGHVSGVQARIKEKQPAVYTHCMAHKLELAVLDSIKCDNCLKQFDERINISILFLLAR